MVRILLAEDHTIIRKGMLQILTDALPQAQIEEIDEGEEWAEKLKDCPWDIIISDHKGFRGRVLDVLHRLDERVLPVLLLNLSTHEPYGYRQIGAGVGYHKASGAAGYHQSGAGAGYYQSGGGVLGALGRDASADELIWAVRQILSGKKYPAIPSKNN